MLIKEGIESQGCRANHAHFAAKGGHTQGNAPTQISKGALAHRLLHSGQQQVVASGKQTSHDDHIGIDDVHQVGKGDSHVMGTFLEHGPGFFIAPSRRFEDAFDDWFRWIGQLGSQERIGMTRCQGLGQTYDFWLRNEGFQTASIATTTGGATHRHNDGVTNLPRSSPTAPVDSTVHHKTCPHPNPGIDEG